MPTENSTETYTYTLTLDEVHALMDGLDALCEREEKTWGKYAIEAEVAWWDALRTRIYQQEKDGNGNPA
jgi:hypothetical protein